MTATPNTVPRPSARKASVTKNGATLFTLVPPLVRGTETHHRVIVADAKGETNVFPTFGPVRVLGKSLKELGYEVAR